METTILKMTLTRNKIETVIAAILSLRQLTWILPFPGCDETISRVTNKIKALIAKNKLISCNSIRKDTKLSCASLSKYTIFKIDDVPVFTDSIRLYRHGPLSGFCQQTSNGAAERTTERCAGLRGFSSLPTHVIIQ